MYTTLPTVLKRDETRTSNSLLVLGNTLFPKLIGEDTNGAVSAAVVKVPLMGGPPLHRHAREDEWFFILKGELILQLAEEQVTAGEGMSILLPRGVPHTFQNFQETLAEALVLATPSGLENFFTEAASTPMFAMGALMEVYGMTVVGAPLGL